MCASGLATLAFFYCDFREDQKRERRGLLSSLLVQLCYQSDAYCDALSEFYLVHGRGSQHASDSELLQCLTNLLGLPGQATTYVIIDALDECPSTTGLPSPREEVLEVVRELVELQIPSLRICVTSRPEADIEPVLGPLAFRSISLHSERGQAQDIAEYIKFVVNSDPKMRTWRQSDKEHVIEVLTTKADGMCGTDFIAHRGLSLTLCDLGLDGRSVSFSTSDIAFDNASDELWRNYQRRSMRHMTARWKKSESKTGNMHTDCFNVSQRLPVHFASKNSPSFLPLTLTQTLRLHFERTGARRTRHMRCYPRAPVCSPSSAKTMPRLSSFRIFQ